MPNPKMVKHSPGAKIKSPKDMESTDGVQNPGPNLPSSAAKTGVAKE